MTGRRTALAIAFGLTLSSASAEEKKAPAIVKVPVAKPPGAPNIPRPQGPRPQIGRPPGANPAQPGNRPGEQIVDRLMKMSPQDREKALQVFPPERRENLKKRLDMISKLPTAQQDRIRTRQEMLNSLEPQRQNQVRRSMQQFIGMPDERRGVINQELSHIAPMTDEDRRSYMNTEEFRNKYSAREQQMLSHLAEITPQ